MTSSNQQAGRTRFRGKSVVVTGGASGIGRAAVLAFAREGGRVAFCDRNEAGGREVEAEVVRLGGEARFFACDVEKPEEIEAVMNGAAECHGGIDIAFNNAGINFFRTLHEIDVDDWDRMFRINTRAVFLSIKFQVPHMLARGGAIVITGSAIQEASRPGGAAYAASKRALMGIAQSAALDYGSRGIRVNVLAPGPTDTPMARSVGASAVRDVAWEKAQAAWAAANVAALKRFATADEIAAAALMLASDDCPFLTGTSLVVDGGITSRLS
jgi:NAD(P)-dependent dehydrogenase (short-subunit alcohol dehydrogenase family)